MTACIRGHLQQGTSQIKTEQTHMVLDIVYNKNAKVAFLLLQWPVVHLPREKKGMCGTPLISMYVPGGGDGRAGITWLTKPSEGCSDFCLTTHTSSMALSLCESEPLAIVGRVLNLRNPYVPGKGDQASGFQPLTSRTLRT